MVRAQGGSSLPAEPGSRGVPEIPGRSSLASMLLVSVNAVGFLGLSYEFRWEILFQHPYLGWLVEGILTTLKLSALAWLQALIIGVLVGAARTLPWRFLRALGASYVELFRNIPLLVHLFFWYFAAPEVLPHAF